MKRIVLFVALAGLVPTRAMAQIGSHRPRASADGYSIGLGVHNSSGKWTYGYQVDNVRFLVEGSRGMGEGAEIYGRLGMGNIVINEAVGWHSASTDLSSNTLTPTGTIGVRGKFWECGKWSVGGTLDSSVSSGHTDYQSRATNVLQKIELHNVAEINTSLSASRSVGKGEVYGGTALHWAYTQADVTTTTFGSSYSTDHDSQTIRDKGSISGFLGYVRPIRNNWSLQVEGQAGNSFSGGVSIFKSW